MRKTPTLLLLLTLGCGGSDAGGDCATIVATQVPSEKGALFEYLGCRSYEALESESAPHSSMAAHGSVVRVFINDALQQSLMQGATEHPVGAAAVKELYAQGGTMLRGWAAMVKVEAGTGGDTWYWYEIFSTTSGASPVADGKGTRICTGCHMAGADFFQTAFPLQ